MLYAGIGLLFIASIVSLVCFVMVLVQMFQRGQSGLGIATILLLFCGVGGILAFVYGWVKSTEWNLKNVMLLWTGTFVIAAIGYGLMMAGGLSMLNDPNLMKGFK